MAIEIEKLFNEMAQIEASDLHLKVGTPPYYRVNGHLFPTEHPKVTTEDVQVVLDKIMPKKAVEIFKRKGSLDFAFSPDEETRFRINAFLQKGNISIALRRLTRHKLSFEELNLPPVINKIAEFRRGLVLMTGPTGTGKTTTMAAIVDYINSTRSAHIVTIEDPIEYLHPDKKSMVEQREVGLDAPSFDGAMREIVRQDPDVILVGEMRDRETIMMAMRAAMTGHLILSTLHTTNAVQTVNRILQYFDSDEQTAIRSDLAVSLRAVISQRLLPTPDKKGRVPAVEVMIVTNLVQKLIREDRISDMQQVIQNAEEGMQTFDQSLALLLSRKLISFEMGLEIAEDQQLFKRLAEGRYSGTDKTGLIGRF
jgi:twitching motility protein PilT